MMVAKNVFRPGRSVSTIVLSGSLFLAACGASAGGEQSAAADAGIEETIDAAVPAEPDAAVIPDEPWITVEPGTFNMGSPDAEACRDGLDETLHAVTLTRAFKMQSRETTQEHFTSVMGYNPSYRDECGPTCPVENLTWHMATAFCNALSAPESLAECFECSGTGEDTVCTLKAEYAGGDKTLYDCPGYRLPTEAEWEYAYRAGAQTALYNGDLNSDMCSATDPKADSIGWFIKNAGSGTNPVGLKAPNAWGFYDMGGNAQEWVYDNWQQDLGVEDVSDPLITNDSGQGIIRGGSFAHAAADMRGAHRKKQTIINEGTSLGVRCVRALGEQID